MTEKITTEVLDQIEAPEALAWVKGHNERTMSELDTPRFREIEQGLKETLDDPGRIPFATIRGEFAYNFWVDTDHPRGLWRRQPADAYLEGGEDWDTLLDVDELAKREGKSWVYQGASVVYPEYTRALLALSDGGSDSHEVREFDIESRSFIEDGFNLPASKGSATWVSKDTVVISRDFGEETMTTSGYPLQVRLWRRGEAVEDAQIIFEGEQNDVGVFAGFDATPGWRRLVVVRMLDFYNSETYIADPTNGRAMHKVATPEYVEVTPWHDWVLLEPKQDWTTAGQTFTAGSLLAAHFDDAFEPGFQVFELFKPTSTSALTDVTLTKSHVIVNVLHHVSNRLGILTPPYSPNDGWDRRDLTLPDTREWQAPEHATISVSAVNPRESDELWAYITGFTTPMTLSLLEVSKSGTLTSARKIRQAPVMFEAEELEVSQHFATSADGTKVPYFQISPKGEKARPTLLYGYGGFEISLTPSYLAGAGRSWLTRGGTYVVANIRGGGEYGPAWHEAARKENRHRAYEDFVAVADDLVERGVTTREQLGAQGGSNGGLLMGVMLTKYPERFGAIVCQVPLLDMKRYHTLSAGASWIAEYGDPSDPAQWEYIKTFSPYHLFDSSRDYPPVLFTTSTRDDRVHPAHARTMVAQMDAASKDVLFFENTEGGHAGAADNTQRAKMGALAWEFLWQHLEGEGGLHA